MDDEVFLGELTLTGARRKGRTFVFGLLAALAALSVVLVVLERHTIPGEPWHSTIGETGGAPLYGAGAALLLTLYALRWPGLASGLVAGLGAGAGAASAIGRLATVHLVAHVESNSAGLGAYSALLCVMIVGLAAAATELLARVRERRHRDGEFPTARVVK